MSEKPYPPPSQLTGYYTGVGRVAVAWSFFETHVNMTIWELADIEQQMGACITAQIIPIMPRFRAMVAIVELRGGTKKMIGKLNSMSSEADALSRRRNRFIHDPAVADANGNPLRLEITADRKLEFRLQPSALTEMRDLEHDITDLTNRFYDLKTEIIGALQPFAPTHLERSDRIRLSPPRDAGMPR